MSNSLPYDIPGIPPSSALDQLKTLLARRFGDVDAEPMLLLLLVACSGKTTRPVSAALVGNVCFTTRIAKTLVDLLGADSCHYVTGWTEAAVLDLQQQKNAGTLLIGDMEGNPTNRRLLELSYNRKSWMVGV